MTALAAVLQANPPEVNALAQVEIEKIVNLSKLDKK